MKHDSKTNRKARISVETLEGRALMTGGHHLHAGLHHLHARAAAPAVIQTPTFPSIIGDQFAITDGIYDYVGRLKISYENVNTGSFRGTYVDRQLNHLGVVMTVAGRLVKDTGFYDMTFSGSGSASRLVSGGILPLVEHENQQVTFGGSLNPSDFNLPMVGILDVHDTFTYLVTTNSDTGPIAVGGRIPKPVPDVSGQTFTIDDASFHKIGTLVITTEDQSSDTFSGNYVDGLHNELGVVQTVHGVIVPNPDSHGPIGFLFAGSGSASRLVSGGIVPLVENEHQSVNFEPGTIQGSGSSATISGLLDLHDDYSSLWINATYDSGQMQVTGLS
jgi:hypothetical protein